MNISIDQIAQATGIDKPVILNLIKDKSK